jgi:hypothetical protein
MPRKPVPPPLSVSQGRIEVEKLAVLKRTEKRIADLEIAARPTRFALAFPILVLLAYTAYLFSTKCECTCSPSTCNV